VVMKCEKCGKTSEWEFLREYTDGRGRRWEVYRCSHCGNTRRYAVT